MLVDGKSLFFCLVPKACISMAIIYFGPKELIRFKSRTERVGNVSMPWQVSNNTWLVLMQQFLGIECGGQRPPQKILA